MPFQPTLASGSIPAWAGETYRNGGRAASVKVYPRVGGGNIGKGQPQHPAGGSIPAWAGETGDLRQGRRTHRVYPRVGGGNVGILDVGMRSVGLSPRGRGKRGVLRRGGRQRRSIPAWAGETEARCSAGKPTAVYPRVGGGNANTANTPTTERGLSPRGRGKLPRRSHPDAPLRSIPAWAGETPPSRTRSRSREVYPRVGGGNSSVDTPRSVVDGLSPRGRGKLERREKLHPSVRSIPAWAGETSAPNKRVCA